MPPVIKGSSTYKLIVPTEVEEKIRYLIRKFPHTEWSGVLFYTHQGSFEEDNLVIVCKDIFPMDLGTSGWTEFKMSEDVAAYMAENIELFDCETGLVHSHHQLGAYFSGQDMKMVQQEGNDTNCFVSLVVDTRGKYVAIVTRKVQTKSEVTIKNLGTSYEFFGEGTKEITHSNTETTKVVDKEVIEYFDLDVERHEVDNTLAYLDTRFDEIVQKKEATKNNTKSLSAFVDNILSQKNYNPKEPTLFDTIPSKVQNESFLTAEDHRTLDDFADLGWKPNPKRVHKAVVTIITCSFITNPDKFELKQWVTKHMVKVYKRIFGENSDEEGLSIKGGAFTEWKDFIIQHIMDYFDMGEVPESIAYNDDVYYSIIARAISEELFEYVGLNPYIEDYCNTLNEYIL